VNSAGPRAADAYAALRAHRAHLLRISQGSEEGQTLVTFVNQYWAEFNIAVQLSLFPSLESARVGGGGNVVLDTMRLGGIRDTVLLGVVRVDGGDLMPDGLGIARQDGVLGIGGEDTAGPLHVGVGEISDLIGLADLEAGESGGSDGLGSLADCFLKVSGGEGHSRAGCPR